MSTKRIVDEFIELIEIDAESYKEREIADVVKRKLKELGAVVSEDSAGDLYGGNAGNVFAVFEGEENSEPILLSAHLDTVGPGKNKKAIIDNERGIITSDGRTVLGSDDVAGIVEILEGIRRVKEEKIPHRTIEVLFPIAEEVYTKGAAAFDYSKVRSKECYCLDLSGNIGTAAYKAPSLISFKVKVIGKASHAGFAPENGVNALLAASKAIAKIEQGHIDDKSTLNIGTIKGGTASNIVAEYVECSGEIRSYNHEKAIGYLDYVNNIFEKEAEILGARIEFEHEVHLIAYEVSKDSGPVTKFVDAAKKIGVEPNLVSTFGGADNHQFFKNGIKGLVLSCGMQNVHSTTEFIEIDDLEKGTLLIKQLIEYNR